jgi:hypothetical protein
MRITRTDVFTPAGHSELVQVDLIRRKASASSGPKWLGDDKGLMVAVRGHSDHDTHDYEVTLSKAEVLKLCDVVLHGELGDPISRAVALGALTTLRELLEIKDQHHEPV